MEGNTAAFGSVGAVSGLYTMYPTRDYAIRATLHDDIFQEFCIRYNWHALFLSILASPIL